MCSDQAQMCRRSHSPKNNMSKCNVADGMKYYRRGASSRCGIAEKLIVDEFPQRGQA
jgi:hypothetical protein